MAYLQGYIINVGCRASLLHGTHSSKTFNRLFSIWKNLISLKGRKNTYTHTLANLNICVWNIRTWRWLLLRRAIELYLYLCVIFYWNDTRCYYIKLTVVNVHVYTQKRFNYNIIWLYVTVFVCSTYESYSQRRCWAKKRTDKLSADWFIETTIFCFYFYYFCITLNTPAQILSRKKICSSIMTISCR